MLIPALAPSSDVSFIFGLCDTVSACSTQLNSKGKLTEINSEPQLIKTIKHKFQIINSYDQLFLQNFENDANI